MLPLAQAATVTCSIIRAYKPMLAADVQDHTLPESRNPIDQICIHLQLLHHCLSCTLWNAVISLNVVHSQHVQYCMSRYMRNPVALWMQYFSFANASCNTVEGSASVT